VIIETDVLDFALGAVLSQREDENHLHPVAFHSRKFTPTEINYKIHNKELLAIVDTFKHWRRYCKGMLHQVQVFSDHQNLEYFTMTKVLNRRQARWAQELVGIDFKIFYRPRSQNGKPDALSRRSEYSPEKGGSDDQPITTVLHAKHFSGRMNMGRVNTIYIMSAVSLSLIPERKWSREFAALVRKAGLADPEYQKGLEAVKNKEKEGAHRAAGSDGSNAKQVATLPCEEQRTVRKARSKGILGINEGLLYWKGILWIPEDKDLIR